MPDPPRPEVYNNSEFEEIWSLIHSLDGIPNSEDISLESQMCQMTLNEEKYDNELWYSDDVKIEEYDEDEDDDFPDISKSPEPIPDDYRNTCYSEYSLTPRSLDSGLGPRSISTSPESNQTNVIVPGCNVFQDLELLKVHFPTNLTIQRMSNTKQPRISYNSKQQEILEQIFKNKKYLNPEQKERLAKELEITPKQVKYWFKNRRQKMQDPSHPCEPNDIPESDPFPGIEIFSRTSESTNSNQTTRRSSYSSLSLYPRTRQFSHSHLEFERQGSKVPDLYRISNSQGQFLEVPGSKITDYQNYIPFESLEFLIGPAALNFGSNSGAITRRIPKSPGTSAPLVGTQAPASLPLSVVDAPETHQTSKPRQPRIHFSLEQQEKLKESFRNDNFLKSDEKERLAKELNVTPQQVKLWFQNRRHKEKKQGKNELMESDC